LSTQPPCGSSDGDSGMTQPSMADTCAGLAEDLGGTFDIRLDGAHPGRAVRYVAIARSLETRPYAVITADLSELRRALAPGGATREPCLNAKTPGPCPRPVDSADPVTRHLSGDAISKPSGARAGHRLATDAQDLAQQQMRAADATAAGRASCGMRGGSTGLQETGRD
jgi:hypothetical protein